MRLSITRDNLLKPLSCVIGVVARGTDLFGKPILGNVLVRLDHSGKLSVTASDMQIEMTAATTVEPGFQPGQATLPARKLIDIVRNLPTGSQIELVVGAERVPIPNVEPVERAVLTAGGGRYKLATLPVADFPEIGPKDAKQKVEVEIDAKRLAGMMALCAPSMANNDVRIFLNAMLLDVRQGQLNCVASDGHRLTYTAIKERAGDATQPILIARKAALELRTILAACDGTVRLERVDNLLRVHVGEIAFSTLLVEQTFPDYEKMLPIGARSAIRVSRQSLMDAVERADILTNGEYHAVSLTARPNEIRVQSSNPEKEAAEEVVDADTRIDALQVGLNANYLLDALRGTSTPEVCLLVHDANTSVIVTESPDTQNVAHIIMPVRI